MKIFRDRRELYVQSEDEDDERWILTARPKEYETSEQAETIVDQHPEVKAVSEEVEESGRGTDEVLLREFSKQLEKWRQPKV